MTVTRSDSETEIGSDIQKREDFLFWLGVKRPSCDRLVKALEEEGLTSNIHDDKLSPFH